MERPRLSRDSKWLDWVIRGVVVLIVLVIGFLAYAMVTNAIRDKNSSLAARATKNLADIVRDDPNNIEARLRYADALAAAGDVRESLNQYSQVLELDEENASALTGLGLISMHQGEWRTAEGYWRKLIDILSQSEFAPFDQRLAKSYHYLGSTLMEVKEYEEAARYLREALRMRSDASDTHFLIAIAYRELDSPAKYREHLDYALQFDPTLPEANYELGQILLEEGDIAGAAEKFRISADNAPPERTEPIDALETLGEADTYFMKAEELQESDPTAALGQVRIAVAIDPQHVDAMRLAATLYEGAGKTEEAITAWENVLALEPRDTESLEAIDRLTKPAQ